MFARRSLRCRQGVFIHPTYSRVLLPSTQPTCAYSTKPPRASPATDALGLPLSPSWSVHALINSYPSPALSDTTLMHLHDLAALLAPAKGTPEFDQLKREMEDLIRLVETVRLAPENASQDESPPDGRVWAQGRGIVSEESVSTQHQPTEDPPSGRDLLQHATRTRNGFYLVDSARSKT